MAMTMQLQILSRETIKPSSPTPPHLKIHTLSLFDQIAPHMYVPLVFFFHPDRASGGADCGVARSQLLRESLSNTLSRYYPLAGRMKEKEKERVECNDEGVTFVEAKVEGLRLGDLLESPNFEAIDLLFADGLQWGDSRRGPFVGIQVTHFECGGLAIGVVMSHKLGDMATLVGFLQHWALITRDPSLGLRLVNPSFDSALFFPRADLPPMSGALIQQPHSACKRIVFHHSKIKALKHAISHKVENPTRVEAVTALIFKAIILSASNNRPPPVMLQTLNLRTRVAPPLPDTTVGSLVSFFPVAAGATTEVELHELVSTMRKEMAEFCDKYAKKYRTKEWGELIKRRLEESREILSQNGVYRCSSGCRFPIYSGVDFGWGAADWVTMAALKMKNTVMMVDDKSGGGIEALISLEDNQMAAFLNNQDLLAFASINPSANL